MKNIRPFSRANVLRAPSVSVHNQSIFISTFRATPQIRTLLVGRTETMDLDACQRKLSMILNILLRSACDVSDGRQSANTLLLPNLELINIALDMPGTWHASGGNTGAQTPPVIEVVDAAVPTQTTSETQSAMDILRNLIVARAAAGAPLRAIRLVASSLQGERPLSHSSQDETPVDDPITIPDEVRALIV